VSKFIHVPGPLDYILHFASPASPIDYLQLPIQTLKVGSLGTHNCLGLAKAKKARILVASTSEVYGDPLVHPQNEDYWGNVNPLGPRACYDEGKRAAETLFMDYHRVHDVKSKIIRIFNTYGPRMAEGDGRVVSNFIVQALRGQDITIYGDGNQTRSFCYVDDLINGMTMMMASENFVGPVNLGNPQEFSMIELANKILDMTGSKSKIIKKSLPQDDPKQRKPNIELAEKRLYWSPEISLDEGLKKTIDYFRKVI